jgi:hypothetical protein
MVAVRFSAFSSFRMSDWDSLISSLNTAVVSSFGIGVTYRPQCGGESQIRAIFQATHDAEEQYPGVYGIIFVQLSDLPVAPQRGDRVVVGDSGYTVFQIQSDSSGGATLSLRLE